MQTQPVPVPQPKPTLPALDPRYEAIRRRDPRAEGTFVYAVSTTGVYCRPTCGARLPRPENVRFFADVDGAEAAGFRACRRCRPGAPSPADEQGAAVDRARAQIEAAEGPVPLAALAAAAGLSPYHFHRLFRRRVGMTPRAYGAAFRLRRFDQSLRGGTSVTTAIYEAGYSSSSRFYEAGSGSLGMTPTALRAGGVGIDVRFVIRPCALGQVLVAATARGICALTIGDDPAALEADLRRRLPRATFAAPDARLDGLARAVVALVDGFEGGADLPLDLIGTAFQQRVWRALRDIPRGTTTTYAELARRIGSPRAVRAVGTACGANPVAVVVPCHRVLRGDGALGGYRWGLDRKQALLARESGAPRPARPKRTRKPRERSS